MEVERSVRIASLFSTGGGGWNYTGKTNKVALTLYPLISQEVRNVIQEKKRETEKE